jgi:phospholipase/carboxylesterase
MIDVARLERALTTGETRDLTNDVPAGLPPARELLIAMLEEMTAKLSADPARTLLGGFSQGAMLSLDVALHTERPFAGLILLSGTLLAQDEWLPRMPARKGLRVFQSHGTMDPLLPFTIAEKLRDAMKAAGLEVEFTAFRGQHEIPPPVLHHLGAFTQSALSTPGDSG